MTCACHGEPAYWFKDATRTGGGRWYCAVKKRNYERARYDRDPIHRIEKNLHDHSRRRKQTIERQRAALVSENGGAS